MGVSHIEFHLDPFDDGLETTVGHCWTLEEAAKMIRDVRIGESAIRKINVFNTIDSIPNKKDILHLRTDPRDYSRPLLKEE
jgi:hypothetical protein